MKKVLLFVLIIGSLFSCRNFGERPDKGDVVASLIDSTANPGEDFSKYAFGKWLKNNPIPDAYSSWGIGNLVSEEIREKLKEINESALKKNAKAGTNDQKIGDFYYSGMDTVSIEKEGISPLKAEMDLVNSIQDYNDVMDVIAHHYTIGVRTGFGYDIYQDQMNSEIYALYLTQEGIGLPDRDYYFNTDENTVKIREDYKTKHLPAMFKISGINSKDFNNDAAVYQLEESLAKASRKMEDLRDPYANYNKYAVKDLNKLTPNINWVRFFEKTGLKNVDTVIIGQPEFFKTFDNQLKKVDLAIWKDYLKWNLVNTFSPYLNKELDREHFRFYGTVLSGKKEQLPRWKRVLDWEEDAMGEILGQLFVKEYFPEKTKKRYEDMVDAVLDAYKTRIENLQWMSPETKKKALVKLGTVKKKVGYPEKWKDFSALQVDKGPFVLNVINGNKWWFNYNMSKYGKPVDRTEWDMTPQTYNAYYNPSNNEIVLPAAIFTIPGFKDAEIDDAVVFGYAGASTIGHEITHGFDDEGRQYDEHGNLKDWWTETDASEFQKRAQVMVEQFNNYTVLKDMHVNGEATLGENIADYGGILIALDAFKKTKQYKEGKSIAGLTPIQRYFLGYALGWLGHSRDERIANQIMSDVHSPTFLRINGPFANIPEFYEAFGIKEGQPMWRADSIRVDIW
ncbi:MAG: M13 family metallopeptidase [Chitinophagales bacterium]|nr:M13 family metallopeptidase [Chitinophagales bacterium]